tara:strand:+ start:9652 stop:10701 length:1050 start_codon:yes stop_codon:yes gene_type:complete
MNYANMIQSINNPMIDMRSDTVTKPTRGMLDAMVHASVGDDVYGDDPTANELQEFAAKLLGKEDALFLASGTQSNLCAMLTHCQRGEEIITGEHYHIFDSEAGGASVLGGIMFAPISNNSKGGLDISDVVGKIKPNDSHYAITKMLSLENTHDGMVQTVSEINDLANCGKKHGLVVHLDGARLMNATVKLNIDVSDMLRNVDSVSLCLSKGLGAPMGTILAGSKTFIKQAHRNRKLLGGAMRQVGVMAAAGLYALKNNVERMDADHQNALRLAEQLNQFPNINVNVDMVETNMVFMDIKGGIAESMRKHLQNKGILIGPGNNKIRLVTHLGYGHEEGDLVINELKDFFN